MTGYILGNYLVESGKITKEQLKEVLADAEKVRVKLGLIAVAEGYMTVGQADEVNRLQAVMDKRFGDIAVESGYLTEGQVTALLKKQGNEYLVFLQTLVDKKLMNMEAADRILKEYQEEKHLTDEECEALKSGEVDRIIPLFLPEEALQYKELIGVAVRTMIRCVDRDLYLMPAKLVEIVNGRNGSFQTLECEDGSSLQAGFIEEDGGFLEAASLFAGEEFSDLNEDALDSCAELLNCIHGIYASAKSKESIELELLPPTMYQEDIWLKAEKKICVLPVVVKGKKLQFVILG